MSRTLKIVLTLSVILNIFLIGAGVAALIERQRLFDEGRVNPPTQLALAARTLDPTVHQALRTFMRAKSDASRADFATARAARLQASQLAALPAFDRAAVSALLSTARASELQGHAKTDEAVLDFMVTMAPDQRAKLAQGFEARPPRPRHVDHH